MYMYNDERLTVGGTSLRFREVQRCSENVIDSHIAQSTAEREVSSEGQMVEYNDMQHGEPMLEPENL